MKGSKRVEVAGVNDKRQITATFAASLGGDFLPFQLLYEGKTERCHPTFKFPDEIDVWHSAKHWSNADLTKRFAEKCIVPYVKQQRQALSLPDDAPALVIFDHFSGHKCEELHEYLSENHILHIFVPAKCTDRLQPLDVSVNKAVKDRLRQSFREWYADQVKVQMGDGTEQRMLSLTRAWQS